MSKTTLLVAAALVAAASSSQAATYKVDRWPGDIDTIPCSAWTHSNDGTWALKGWLKVGGSEIENVGVKGDAASRSLDKRCGK